MSERMSPAERDTTHPVPSVDHRKVEEPGFANGISAVYFFYLAGVGLAVTFWPFHMQALGFTGAQIGRLFMVRTGLNIVAQPAITRIADAVGRPIAIIRVALLWGAIVPCGMLLFDDWWMIAACMWGTGILTSSLVPLLDASIVTRLPNRSYGSVRLWGSLGYGMVVCGFGLFMRNVEHATAGKMSIFAWLAVMLIASAFGARLSDRPTPSREERKQQSQVQWVSGGLIAFFVLNLFHWYGMFSFNIFYGLHTEELGFSPFLPALGVLVAIVAEAIALRIGKRVLRPSFAAAMLPVVYALTGVRWALTAWAVEGPLLVAAQALQFFGYGIWIACMMTVIGALVPDVRRNAAQGLMGSIVLGCGGMLGALVSGYFMDIGAGRLVFAACAVADVIALALFAAWWVACGRDAMARQTPTVSTAA